MESNNNNNNNNNPANVNHEAVLMAAIVQELINQGGGSLLQPVDTTMLLQPDEMSRAVEIKLAAAERPDLKPLSDFEYVHYAICTSGESMEEVLYRMEMMQAFKEEYGIQDTVQQGIEMMDQLTRVDQPGFLVSMEYLPSSQNFLSVTAWCNLIPGRCKTDEQWRVFIGSMYYKYQAKFNQFLSIRNGSTSMVECMDTTMEKNCDIRFYERFMHELFRFYPVNPKEMFFINSNSGVNFVMGMWQKWMRPDMRSSVQLGHQIRGLEGQRVDVLYKTPSEEVARQHMLTRVASFLNNRYQNERTFSLTPLPARN